MLEQMIEKKTFSFQKLDRIVKRQKVNLKSFKQILIPINKGQTHWQLLCIDLLETKFRLIDSMNCSQWRTKEVVQNIKVFFQEYLNKQKSTLSKIKCDDNLENWTVETVKGPQQTNGYDCGVAVCFNMELLSRKKELAYDFSELDFSQYARERIAVELMFGQLLAQ